MKEYLLQMQCSIGGAEWTLPFSQPSDAMAIDYTRRLCIVDPALEKCHSVVLFDPERAHIATFHIDQKVRTVSIEPGTKSTSTHGYNEEAHP